MHPAVSPIQGQRVVTTVGMHLAERLGYLPLALAVAASYMRRCDLDAEEYLAKLDRTSTRAPHSTTTTPEYDLSLSDRCARANTMSSRNTTRYLDCCTTIFACLISAYSTHRSALMCSPRITRVFLATHHFLHTTRFMQTCCWSAFM